MSKDKIVVPIQTPTIANCLKVTEYTLGEILAKGTSATAYVACNLTEKESKTCKYVVKIVPLTDNTEDVSAIECSKKQIELNSTNLYDINREMYFIKFFRKLEKKDKFASMISPKSYAEFMCGSNAFLISERYEQTCYSLFVQRASVYNAVRKNQLEEYQTKIKEVAQLRAQYTKQIEGLLAQSRVPLVLPPSLQAARARISPTTRDYIATRLQKANAAIQQENALRTDLKQLSIKQYDLIILPSELNQMMAVVRYINSKGWIHGDAHFSNFFYKPKDSIYSVGEAKNTDHLVISDFGRAGDFKMYYPMLLLLNSCNLLKNLSVEAKNLLLEVYDVLFFFWFIFTQITPKRPNIGIMSADGNVVAFSFGMMYTYVKESSVKYLMRFPDLFNPYLFESITAVVARADSNR